jgi:hypothetical protein
MGTYVLHAISTVSARDVNSCRPSAEGLTTGVPSQTAAISGPEVAVSVKRQSFLR